VIERLTEFTDDLGAGIVLGAGGHMGSMPHWQAMKCMQIMAEEVIPHFRAPDGKPSYMRTERPGSLTLTEHAATVERPKLRPRARLDGDGLVETELAHIPEVSEATPNGGRAATEGKVG
jgi:hypothetical protein